MKRIFLALLLMPLFTNAQDTTGMIAHWVMNGNAKDATGKGHDGNMNNVLSDTGRYGVPNAALHFNGTNSYISVPYKSDINLSKYSICVIVKVTGFYNGLCQGNFIFARGSGSLAGPQDGHYLLGFSDNQFDNDCYSADSTKDVFYTLAGNNAIAVTSQYYTPNIVKNRWYSVVATYDGSNYKIYVDGVLKLNKPGLGYAIGTSTDSIVIGENLWESTTGYPYDLNGSIDDIRLYGRALADSETVYYYDTCGRVTLQPKADTIISAHNASFTINTNIINAVYQWQQDAGSGYTNLTNTAPYSGVYTNTLTITSAPSSLNNTHYRCIVNNNWVCTDTSHIALLTVQPGNGVSSIANDPVISVYPNPAKNTITIELPGSEGATVEIINAIGQVVLERSFTGYATQTDVSELAAGVYIVRIKYNDYIITKKLLKE